MKKYFLLTSILVLAACGGGAGGGGSSGPTARQPRAAMSNDAIASNRDITKMASEILVATDGVTSPVIQRSAAATHNGQSWTSYRLDDVKFFVADQKSTTDRAFLRLELDNTGQIDAIHMELGGQSSGRTVRSEADPTMFEGPIFEYVPDGESDAVFRVVDTGQNMAALNKLATNNHLTGGHWNRIDERLDVKTHGEDITDGSGDAVSLTYSDFGHFNPVYKSKNKALTSDADIIAARNGTLNRSSDLDKYRDNDKFLAELAKEDYQLFAGGYAIKNGVAVDSLNPESGMVFKGKAIGRVYTSIESKGDGIDKTTYLSDHGVPYDNDSNGDNDNDSYSNNAGHDIAKAYMTADAKMTISNNGDDIVQTLYMPFHSASVNSDQFYDITIRQTGNEIDQIQFTASDESDIGAEYRKYGALDTEAGDFKYVDFSKSTFQPGYYGVDEISEAAGTAKLYTKQRLWTDSGDANRQVNREWEVQAAWGMQPQNP